MLALATTAGAQVLGFVIAAMFLIWLFAKIGGHITRSGVCPYCGKGLKTNAVACHHCGRGHPKRVARGGGRPEWRCEKNDHLLAKSTTVCPIDGSPGRWKSRGDKPA